MTLKSVLFLYFINLLKFTTFVENELYEDKTDYLPSGISQFL